jgi:hypothetical protein
VDPPYLESPNHDAPDARTNAMLARVLTVVSLYAVQCGGRDGMLDSAQPDATFDASPVGLADGSFPSDVSNPRLDCALRGQQCFGRACCTGAGDCLATPSQGSTTYTCGGVLAGGMDEGCLSDTRGCAWRTLAGCVEFGPISKACGTGRVAQLRRCDGSCFAPDELYQQYGLCSCDAAPRPGVPACDCVGTSWSAILCCS